MWCDNSKGIQYAYPASIKLETTGTSFNRGNGNEYSRKKSNCKPIKNQDTPFTGSQHQGTKANAKAAKNSPIRNNTGKYASLFIFPARASLAISKYSFMKYPKAANPTVVSNESNTKKTLLLFNSIANQLNHRYTQPMMNGTKLKRQSRERDTTESW